MHEVFAKRVRGNDLETSLSKLVSAFLAVAEDVAVEGDRAKEDVPQRVAASPATTFVARSKTPQQGADGRDADRNESEPRGRTKRRGA